MIIDSDASVIVPSTNFLYTEMIDENIIDSFVEWHYNHSQKYFNKGLGESINEKNRETGEDDLSSPLGLVNAKIKESMDTPYMNMVILPKVNDFVSAVDSCMGNYVRKFPFSAKGSYFHMDPGWNVQEYPKGGGYKEWHTERSGSAKSNVYRHLVWMVYLNSVPNGGTEWFHQDHYEEAEKGKCCIWPADWTYTHKGRVTHEFEKIIATGWYSYA
tara:strand:- start:3826 stop:4470 length:645 start_codon:yes stop_codon:yes gene_type:complete